MTKIWLPVRSRDNLKPPAQIGTTDGSAQMNSHLEVRRKMMFFLLRTKEFDNSNMRDILTKFGAIKG